MCLHYGLHVDGLPPSKAHIARSLHRAAAWYARHFEPTTPGGNRNEKEEANEDTARRRGSSSGR